MLEKLLDGVEKNRELISAAYDRIWKNPETGYREWKTNEYLKNEYEKLGYELTMAGNIPGFITEIDTGRPGPTVAVFGEMDALICATHPEADPATGAVHACGHCAQSAALLGLAAALKEPGALDGMSGKIRLIAVPAEELIEIEYRQKLYDEGIIRYFGGKQEFIYRGLLDGADMAIMIHNSTAWPKGTGRVNLGSNGCMIKTIVFHGKASHAGGSPHRGRNALYAATQALTAINAIRETFRDEDHIRVHGIITQGGDVANTIPDRVVMEFYVRGANGDAIKAANEAVNRAVSGAAVSLGCTVTIDDRHGYFPRIHDRGMMEAAREGMELALEHVLYIPEGWTYGCSDFGDITSIMPGVHPHIGGSRGTVHGSTYYIDDPAGVCTDSAKAQAGILWILLKDGAERALRIKEDFTPVFATKEEYLKFIDDATAVREAVSYLDDGSILIK